MPTSHNARLKYCSCAAGAAAVSLEAPTARVMKVDGHPPDPSRPTVTCWPYALRLRLSNGCVPAERTADWRMCVRRCHGLQILDQHIAV
jgi:hypothetical protein